MSILEFLLVTMFISDIMNVIVTIKKAILDIWNKYWYQKYKN